MSRYSDIDIRHLLDNSIKRLERIDNLKTDDYDSSILFNNDIGQNDELFKRINDSVNKLLEQSKIVLDDAKGATTDFNKVIDNLNRIPGTASIIAEETSSVRIKIYNASKEVFTEKISLYNENKTIIDSTIDSIEGCLEDYSSYYDKYKTYEKKYNQALEDDPNKNDYKKKMDEYKGAYKESLNSAESFLKNLTSKLDENEEIVNNFIKKYI